MEWNELPHLYEEQIKRECISFLKLLVRNIGNKQKYLTEKIQNGDTTCFTGLEFVIRKWCDVLRIESYKVIIRLAFQKGKKHFFRFIHIII